MAFHFHNDTFPCPNCVTATEDLCKIHKCYDSATYVVNDLNFNNELKMSLLSITLAQSCILGVLIADKL